MKPRPTHALTEEDSRILYHGFPFARGTVDDPPRAYWFGVLAGRSELQDCRDADLMLHAQQMRFPWRKINPLVAHYEDTDRINIGGALWWLPYPYLSRPEQ